MATRRLGLSGFVVMRAAVVLATGLALCACSSLPSVPGWADPTSWFGPDVPDQSQADNQQSPDLAQMPQRPSASSAQDQQQVANSLAAAGGKVQYSAQALRGGTEAVAPPPEPAASPAQVAKAEEGAAAPSPTPAATASVPTPRTTASASVAPQRQPVPGPTHVASTERPAPDVAPSPPAQTALPSASAKAVPGAQPPVTATSSLGFQPSKAPPLNASVAEFVPRSIIASYARTAPVASAGAPAGGDVKLKAPSGTPSRKRTGDDSEVAKASNLPSVSGASGMYLGVPVTSVMFSGNSTVLGTQGRAQVRAAAAAYKAQGGQGYVRIVGHYTSAKGKMSDIRHMEYDFRRSQARAKAVARELIREGVPAEKVLISAVGGSGSTGSGANNGAEIFLQG